MTTVTTRAPLALNVNDVIVRDPDHPEKAGKWTVELPPVLGKDGLVHVDYTTDDGTIGRFVVDVGTEVTIGGPPPSPFEEQHTAAQVMCDLTAAAIAAPLLPRIYNWSITSALSEPTVITAQVSTPGKDTERTGIELWAAHLGGQVAERAYNNAPGKFEVFTEVEIRGVRVKMWDSIDRPDTTEPAADDAQPGAEVPKLTITVTKESMTSTRTAHTAARHPGGWAVSWLPGRLLTRHDAIGAMTFAEIIDSEDLGDHVTAHLAKIRAEELGLSRDEAIQLMAANPVHADTDAAVQA